MMVKTDVSVLYKTKLCKKFSANGWCPYGMRCQFIHDISETQNPQVQQTQKIKQSHVKSNCAHQHAPQPAAQASTPLKAPVLPPKVVVQPTPKVENLTETKQEETSTSTSSSEKEKTTISIVNVQPFIPKPKVSETNPEVSKEVDTVVKTENKKSLNPDTVAFVPTKVQVTQVVAQPTPVTGPIGGLGNKQTRVALASEKVIYTEVLVHCIKISIQEYQKKLKMFNKKVANKKRFIDFVDSPTIQYINIYSHGNVRRLSCFQRITECSAAFMNVKEDDDNEGGYFYGDATSYEKHLDQQIHRYEKAVKSGHYQQKQ